MSPHSASPALSVSVDVAGCSIGDAERVGGERAADISVLTMLDPIGNRQELTQFVDEVSRLSDGTLEIRLVTAGHDGADYEAATIRDVQDGRADLAFAGNRAWDEFGARSLRALGAPFLVDSYPLQEAVLTSGLVDSMLEELQPLGLVGIGILPGPIRRPLGVANTLAAPSDFRGRRSAPNSPAWPARPCASSAPTRSDSPPMSPASSGSTASSTPSPPSRSPVSARTVRVSLTNVNLWPRRSWSSPAHRHIRG